MLAMGDALAVVLLTKRGFQARDFQRFHPGRPGGAPLPGHQGGYAHRGPDSPLPVRRACGFGHPGNGGQKAGGHPGRGRPDKLAGIVTDGDLRGPGAIGPDLGKNGQGSHDPDPLAVGPGTLASRALELMEQKAIMVLPVVDDDRQSPGDVRLHDLLGRGEV